MSQGEYFKRKRRLSNNSNLNQFDFTITNLTNTRQPLGELTNHLPTYPEQNKTKHLKAINQHDSVPNDSLNVSRRNERERNRVKLLNLGFDRLRAVVPCQAGEQLSKISTLKKAIWYIEHLDRVLHGQENRCNLLDTTFNDHINDCLTSSQASDTHKSSSVNASNNNASGSTEVKTGNERIETGSGASWTSFDNQQHLVDSFYHPHLQRQRQHQLTSTPSHRRPVLETQRISPVFPTNWDLMANEAEFIQKSNHQHQYPTHHHKLSSYSDHNRSDQKLKQILHYSANEYQHDSGYASCSDRTKFDNAIPNDHHPTPVNRLTSELNQNKVNYATGTNAATYMHK